MPKLKALFSQRGARTSDDDDAKIKCVFRKSYCSYGNQVCSNDSQQHDNMIFASTDINRVVIMTHQNLHLRIVLPPY